MNVATTGEPVTPTRRLRLRQRLLPFGDPSRGRRLVKVLSGVLISIVVVGLLELLGVDVAGWLSDMWDALTSIGLGYLLAGWSLQTLQTTLTALGWYYILCAAYPRAPAPYRQVLAAYASGVALNGFLPANIGTFVMLLMFVAITLGANFPGVVGGMFVQKILYQSVRRLCDGWRNRVPLHQLYPLLAHVVLFGGGYGRQTEAAAQSALTAAG